MNGFVARPRRICAWGAALELERGKTLSSLEGLTGHGSNSDTSTSGAGAREAQRLEKNARNTREAGIARKGPRETSQHSRVPDPGVNRQNTGLPNTEETQASPCVRQSVCEHGRCSRKEDKKLHGNENGDGRARVAD